MLTQALLAVSDVTVRFGGIVALNALSFEVLSGQICGVIGPNGAGKTTLFNCLSRIYDPSDGALRFDGRDLLASAPHSIAGVGIGRTFQNLALFDSMTVRQNVMIGRHCRSRSGYISNVLRLPSVRKEEAAIAERARVLIDFLQLGGVADVEVSALPFGTRKRVELARALASDPKLLLLDEPAAGLNHAEVDGLRSLILDIRDRLKMTILLVEHHMNLVIRVSDKDLAIDFGRKIAEGSPADVQSNEDVVRAYLGSTET